MDNETIKEQVRALIAQPETAKKVLDAITDNRKPKGWSRRSRSTYYSEHYALQIKPHIDKMMVDKQDLVWPYDAWDRFTPNTIYLRVNQSIRYLVDHLDPDGKYNKFFQMVRVSRNRKDKCICAYIIPEFAGGEGTGFEPLSIVPSVEMPKWKQKIEHWLTESEPGEKPFVLDRLMLTPEEIKDMKIMFSGMTHVVSSVSSSCIKLIKLK